MNSIKNGYVIHALILPGGGRKSIIYIEKTKDKAIASLYNEAKQTTFFLYGQKFFINVFSNYKLIFSMPVMPYIKYKMPLDTTVHFTYEDENDAYSSANMYINDELQNFSDRDDGYDGDENEIYKLINYYHNKHNTNYTEEEVINLLQNNIAINSELLDAIPDITISPDEETSFPIINKFIYNFDIHNTNDKKYQDIIEDEDLFIFSNLVEGLNDLDAIDDLEG